jgi:hypothetical protein
MSDYTRDVLLAAADEEAEATGSSRWSSTLKLQRLDWVFAREWRKILAANPTYRWGLRTPTATSGATILYTTLDSGAADTLERFSKVLAVAREGTLYEESRFEDHPLLTLEGAGPVYRWWPEGDHLALPASDANAAMRVWVSHTPQKPSALANGSSVVTFPRDYSGVLVYELAASLLGKGGAETDLAIELKGFAQEIRAEMLDEISRRSTQPTFIRPVDSDAGWGAR